MRQAHRAYRDHGGLVEQVTARRMARRLAAAAASAGVASGIGGNRGADVSVVAA